jgi:hypothetical protein
MRSTMNADDDSSQTSLLKKPNVNHVLMQLRAELRDVSSASCLIVVRNDSSVTLALHRADVSSSTAWIAVEKIEKKKSKIKN